MKNTQRIPTLQLSREQLDADSMLSEYAAGYCHFTVTSCFRGSEKLEELFYQIILRKQMDNMIFSPKECPFAIL